MTNTKIEYILFKTHKCGYNKSRTKNTKKRQYFLMSRLKASKILFKDLIDKTEKEIEKGLENLILKYSKKFVKIDKKRISKEVLKELKIDRVDVNYRKNIPLITKKVWS